MNNLMIQMPVLEGKFKVSWIYFDNWQKLEKS
jgi:hypothetical protein